MLLVLVTLAMKEEVTVVISSCAWTNAEKQQHILMKTKASSYSCFSWSSLPISTALYLPSSYVTQMREGGRLKQHLKMDKGISGTLWLNTCLGGLDGWVRTPPPPGYCKLPPLDSSRVVIPAAGYRTTLCHMRGVAPVTVAPGAILSWRNVHSGLMASSTAPNWKALSFLCVMFPFSPRLRDPLSLWIMFWSSFDWDWPDILDIIGCLRAGGKDSLSHSVSLKLISSKMIFKCFHCIIFLPSLIMNALVEVQGIQHSLFTITVTIMTIYVHL